MLRKTILLLMGAAALAFGVLALLGAAGWVDPRLAAFAFGVALLAGGADEMAGALVLGWPRGDWEPPPGDRRVPAGRLSCLGSGLLLASTGVLFIGLDQMPRPALLVAGAVWVVGLALALLGGSHDRRAGAARRGPNAEPLNGL